MIIQPLKYDVSYCLLSLVYVRTGWGGIIETLESSHWLWCLLPICLLLFAAKCLQTSVASPQFFDVWSVRPLPSSWCS